MSIEGLKKYLNKAANLGHPILQQQAVGLNQHLMNLQEDEDVVDADVQKEQPILGGNNQQQQLEPEDIILQQAMPEMQLPDDDDSSFGKVSCLQALRKKASRTKNKPVTLFSVLQSKYGNRNYRR